MIAAQLGIGVHEAMVRMRARAYAEGTSLTDLASSVVGGAIRFDDGDKSPPSGGSSTSL